MNGVLPAGERAPFHQEAAKLGLTALQDDA